MRPSPRNPPPRRRRGAGLSKKNAQANVVASVPTSTSAVARFKHSRLAPLLLHLNHNATATENATHARGESAILTTPENVLTGGR